MQYSMRRMFVAIAFFAAAAGCAFWARHLVVGGGGPDRLVMALVFGVPALIAAGIVCLAVSERAGAITLASVFAGIIGLAFVANLVVPLLK